MLTVLSTIKVLLQLMTTFLILRFGFGDSRLYPRPFALFGIEMEGLFSLLAFTSDVSIHLSKQFKGVSVFFLNNEH